MGKSWLFASGKGGVGKSTVASCLGIALARLGHRVCIVDADIGLRDQDAIMGLENRVVYDIIDVTKGRCTLEQALIPSPLEEKLLLLPAAQFARAGDLKHERFDPVLRKLTESFDDVLIDCPAGIEKGLRNMLHSKQDGLVLICTPDDVCMRDVERTAMVLRRRSQPRPLLIVNRLDDDLIRAGEMYTAAVVAQTIDLELLGELPDDIDAYRALLSHRSPMEFDCELADAVTRVARRMCGEAVPLPGIGTGRLPWYARLFRFKPDRLSERKQTLSKKGGQSD